MTKRRRQSNPMRPAAPYMVNINVANSDGPSSRQGRFFLAKWLQEQKHAGDLEQMIDMLVERVDTLLDALYGLVDDALTKPQPQVFKRAWDIDRLIREYEKGRRK